MPILPEASIVWIGHAPEATHLESRAFSSASYITVCRPMLQDYKLDTPKLNSL